MEFISAKALEGKSSKQKLKLILERVKKNTIVVLESPLTPEEQKELIERTMEEVSAKFPGIEVSSLGSPTASSSLRDILLGLLGGKPRGLTIVGPSKLVKKIKRNPESIRLLAGE